MGRVVRGGVGGRSPLTLTILAWAVLTLVAPANAQEAIVIATDRDDDDADGVPDGEQAVVAASPELYSLAAVRATAGPKAAAAGSKFTLRGDAVRVLVDGKPVLGPTFSQGARRLELQATHAGRAELDIFGRTVHVGAIEVHALDGPGNEVDLTRSHASLQRTPPDRLPDDPFTKSADPDAIRFFVVGIAEDLPPTLTILSVGPSGAAVDSVSGIPLGEVPCPPPKAAAASKGMMTCASTHPIRAVADDIDRNHPMVQGRSIKAELGGALVVATPHGDKLQMIRVGGPRLSAIGPIVRYRARLRVLMVRATPHGAPPMGGDVAGAIKVAQSEVRRANALWGACGISFGPPEELDAQVVDPPRSHLLAFGDGHGLPATGGVVRFRVDGRDVTAKLTLGMRPAQAARVVGAAVASAGFIVRQSDNLPIAAGAYGSADVLVRRRDGTLAALEPPVSGTLSNDPTMTATIGQVDLEDGLQHFGDIDAIAGTVEERTLIKAFDDGDPGTIEVFMVPSFAGGGRIGESFISADGGAIRNAVIEDRAGVRADRASFALSHELGHVLLDEPGHPDDFGLDTPTRLMDADAANSSAYGPRRLLVEECVRAIRQSGPASSVPLFSSWPLAPIGKER